MNGSSANVNRWVNKSRDPSAEAVYEIRQALLQLDPAAAEASILLYLYDE